MGSGRYLNFSNGTRNNDVLAELALRLDKLIQERKSTSETDELLFELGAKVSGPLLCGMVLFVSRLSAKYNIDQVYCLARDGQLIKHAMDVLSDNGLVLPRVDYCLASRAALRRPEMFVTNNLPPYWLFQGGGGLCLEMIFANLGMDIARWRPWLEKNGWPSGSINRPLSAADRKAIAILLSRDEFRSELLNTAGIEYLAARKYLRSLGLFDAKHPAICDVGWRGTLQNSMQSIINANDEKIKLHGFYIGLENFFDSGSKDGKSPYINSDTSTQKLVKSPGFTRILEILLPADHAGVVRYKEYSSGELVEFAEKHQAMGYSEHYRNYVLGVQSCLQNFSALVDLADIEVGLEDSLHFQNIRNLDLLVNSPTRQEARVIGRMLHSIQPMHNYPGALVPKLSVAILFRMIFSKGSDWGYWHAGILKTHGLCLGGILVLVCKCRSGVGKILRIIKKLTT